MAAATRTSLKNGTLRWVLRLFQVGHLVQNRQGALRLMGTTGFHAAKTKNERFTAAAVALSSEHQK